MKKQVIITILFFILFLCILRMNIYASNEEKYTNYPVKQINGKEVIFGIDVNKNMVKEIITEENFPNSYNIKAYKENQLLQAEEKIGTGTVIKIMEQEKTVKEYTVIIYGDVTGNGAPSAVDALAIIKNKLNKKLLENEIYIEAGRVLEKSREENAIPSAVDALCIVKQKLGKYNIQQITSKERDEMKNTNQEQESGSINPVSIHGKLQVKGTNIVDKNGEVFALKGVSTHGIAWYPQYINKNAFLTMRDEWGINTVRLAMYSDPNAGYTTQLHQLVKNGVDYATELGLYVIIDWHILSDGNPNTYKEQSIEFFKEMANLYKNNNNVLYEICNEPNGDVQWERDIKPYAQNVIAEIRKIDKDAIILCGTPTWSQDVDVVANNPIQGYDNIMYTLHFYAATHKDGLRNKAQNALNKGLPLFVSEFGICDASGNGSIDEQEANKWIDFLNINNISWICWNLSNKNESSALLSTSTNKVSNWTQQELSQEGKWLIKALQR